MTPLYNTENWRRYFEEARIIGEIFRHKRVDKRLSPFRRKQAERALEDEYDARMKALRAKYEIPEEE